MNKSSPAKDSPRNKPDNKPDWKATIIARYKNTIEGKGRSEAFRGALADLFNAATFEQVRAALMPKGEERMTAFELNLMLVLAYEVARAITEEEMNHEG